MSIKLTQLIWKSRINILPSEKLVLLCLANFANDRNNLLCCPPINLISQNCSLSRDQTRRILRNLSASNLIKKVTREGTKGGQISNHYEINEAAITKIGGCAHAHPPCAPMHTPPVHPRTPYNISNNETIKKENNIKENSASTPKDHPLSVLRSTAKLVIDFLRQKTGRNYTYAETTLKPIIERLKEGITLQQCKAVIVRKHREWGNNKEMEKYLRPSTLFRKSNFYDKYLPELITEEEKKNIMKSI